MRDEEWIKKGEELKDGRYEYMGQVKDTGKCLRLTVYAFWESKGRGVLGVQQYQSYVPKKKIEMDDGKERLKKKIKKLMDNEESLKNALKDMYEDDS